MLGAHELILWGRGEVLRNLKMSRVSTKSAQLCLKVDALINDIYAILETPLPNQTTLSNVSNNVNNNNDSKSDDNDSEESEKIMIAAGLKELFFQGKLQWVYKLKRVQEIVPYIASTGGEYGLPELPGISDAKIRTQVFAHKSFSYGQYPQISFHRQVRDNNRLELLGDSVIGFLVTKILYERYPLAKSGKLSKVKSQIICNRTMAKWSDDYGLTNMILISPELHTQMDDEEYSKLKADVFESYAAGILLDDNWRVCGGALQKWIAGLVNHYIFTYDSYGLDSELMNNDYYNHFAKKQFVSLLKDYDPTAKITYDLSSDPQNHSNETVKSVICSVNNNKWSVGRGKSFKEASNNAASKSIERLYHGDPGPI